MCFFIEVIKQKIVIQLKTNFQTVCDLKIEKFDFTKLNNEFNNPLSKPIMISTCLRFR